MSIDDKLDINEVLEELDKLKIETEVGKEYLTKAKELCNYIKKSKEEKYPHYNGTEMYKTPKRINSVFESVIDLAINENKETYIKNPIEYLNSLFNLYKKIKNL